MITIIASQCIFNVVAGRCVWPHNQNKWFIFKKASKGGKFTVLSPVQNYIHMPLCRFTELLFYKSLQHVSCKKVPLRYKIQQDTARYMDSTKVNSNQESIFQRKSPCVEEFGPWCVFRPAKEELRPGNDDEEMLNVAGPYLMWWSLKYLFVFESGRDFCVLSRITVSWKHLLLEQGCVNPHLQSPFSLLTV